MDFSSMLVDLAISEFSEVLKPKKDSAIAEITKPEPIEGFGELVRKAIGNSINLDLGDDEMNLAYNIANFFGK